MVSRFLQSEFYLEKHRPFLWIVVLGFLIYAPTLFFGFTYLDDNTLILNNQPFLNNPLNVLQAFCTDVFHLFNHSAFYYRPILTLSLMLDYQIGGALPFIYHFSNIIFHLLTVGLLFIFLKKIGFKKEVAFLGALLYLSHPVLTQAVAWIPGRNDSLLAIFILSSFIFFIKFLEKNNLKNLIFHLLFFALALFTKETAVSVIPLFIIYAYCLDTNKKDFSQWGIPLGWLALLGLWFFLRSLVPNNSVFIVSPEMVWSVFTNLPAVIQLVGKAIFPVNLSVLPILQDTTFVYGGLALLCLVCLFYFKQNKRWNYILFGMVWFFLFLLPSFLRLNASLVTDFIEHRLYLPLVGLLILVGELNPLKDWQENKTFQKFVLVIILFFSIGTIVYSFNFRSGLTFWKNAVENSPHHPLAHRNLGAMFYLRGDLSDAEKEFTESLKINPNEEMAHNNLGLVYFRQDNFVKAEEEYLKEIEINPFYDNVYYNLGLLYYEKNQWAEAEASWQKAREINPDNLDVIYNLLSFYYNQKDYEQARIYANEIYQRGLDLPPDFLVLLNLPE